MMNNKGVTLIEILVSISLLSIVMFFLFYLLTDLKNEESLSSSSNEDAITRSAIIRLIENDFVLKDLKGIKNCPNITNSTEKICMIFIYNNDIEKKLEISSIDNYIAYNDEKWTLKAGNFDLNNFKYCYNNSGFNNPNISSPYYSLKITIPISHVATTKRKMDIELTYIDNKTNISYLTEFLNGNCT